MGAALDMTSFDFALKQHYVDFAVKNLVYEDQPFHAILPKMEAFGGENLPIPLLYANPQGRAATFSNAQGQKSSSKGVKFVLIRNHDYSLANIDNETIEASMGNADAFMQAATTEIDGAIHSGSRSLGIAEFRNGTGSIGQISSGSTVASLVLSLSDPEQITNFEVGMTIGASSADGSGARTGSAVITNIDRDAGNITTSGSNWSTQITSLATGDFLYVLGDFNGKISGLDAWIPLSAPGSTAFFGVDRSQDTTRLGGCRLNRVGAPIEDALIDLSARVGREGGKVDYCFLNTTNYASLEKALGSKVIYTNPKASDAEVFFQGMKIMGNKGPVTVVADANCFGDRAYMLQLNTWKLYSLGQAPKILQSDGLKFLRNSTADSVEVRVGYYAQMGCQAPGWNGVVQLA